MKRTRVLLVLALAAGCAGQAWADSPLAAAARQEKKRRAKTPDPVKVITNDDLGPASGVAATPEESASGGAPNAAAPEASGTSASDLNARRDDIQREINAQVERMRVVRQQVADAERELADQLGPSFGPRRAQNAQLRDDGLKAIAEIEARIAELETEARRLGVSVTRPQ